jgi:C4-dicarboxylate-binding protein DctP
MRVLLGCFILLFLVACGHSDSVSGEKQKETLGFLGNKVVFSHVVGRDTPKGKGAILLKDRISEQKLLFYGELQIYPDSLLFNDTKVMEALEKDKVQLAAPSISKLVEFNPKLKIFDFPFLFKDLEEVEQFYSNPEVKKKLFYQDEEGINYLDKDKHYVVLSLWHGGMKQLSSSKNIELTSSKPLEYLKFRIQSSEILKLTFEALGAEPVIENNFKKVRQQLQKNELDGQENTWSNIYTEEYHKDGVQKYFIETNHGYLGYLLITNKNFWNELKEGKNYNDIWKTQIDEVTKEVKILANKSNKNAKETIKEEQIRKLDNKPREQWCETIYSTAQAQKWKEFTKEIEELILAAIEGKTGCPFSYLKRILDQSKFKPSR